MAVTDARLTDAEKSILAGMIGKTLEEFVHDEYIASPSTYIDRGPGASKRLPDAMEDMPKGDRKYATVKREVISLNERSESRA